MISTNKDHSEKSFQNRLVDELVKYRWSAPDHLNGNIMRVTVQDLINNWRKELNRINIDQLEGVPLTDNEFKQVMAQVYGISNSYEAAKILAAENSIGKIDGIYRDPNPKITRKNVTLTIFKKAQVSGGDSSYQVAREVSTPNNNRFDIILLINGLPLINIELKRTDKTLAEAFGQFKRYYRDGEYTNNFMAFSQMMVICSEIDTRYFATPKSLDGFNDRFLFRWADKNNVPVVQWKEVVNQFLMIPMAHQMVGDYLIIDEAKDEENRRHMVMRPYQVHALQAVEAAAGGWKKDEPKHGGFVWHTTGSGKTVTSFKTALFLATRLNYDKVIFLVDRRELDSRTSENFKAYAEYESVTVDDTNYTYQLRESLLSPRAGIVVTTTHKMNNLVKELLENEDNSLGEKSFVFIVDEAHRTTMGQMMGNIQYYFRKHSYFYGFTGTPLFEENMAKGKINEKSELIDTTEKLFGPMLHKYTIDEAIADGNVLGFNVDYINTGEFISYEKLRDDLCISLQAERMNEPFDKIERHVVSMSDAEVESLAARRGILVYRDEIHIPRVVKRILDGWKSQSQDYLFNAILTVALKERVMAYFDEFQKQLKNRGEKLNIAVTFSFGNENDPNGFVEDSLKEKIFDHYEKFTGIKFIADDKKKGEDAYFEDLIGRFARGGSFRNPKNIDLVIVADQLLTGYDSKYLNTLYVDRSLALQGLIQAYSRTNRVFGPEKEFGSIINFQFPALTKENVDTALVLYGSGGSSRRAIVDKYETAVAKLSDRVDKLRDALSDPTKWITLEHDDKAREEFFDAFKATAEQMNFVQQYYRFTWESIAHIIDQHKWLQYIGAYKNLKRDILPPHFPPGDVIYGKTRLVNTQLIDAAYIIKLIGSKVTSKDGIQTVDAETLRLIHEKIQELSNLGEDIEARLLRKFVDTELVPGHLSSNINFDEVYAKWKHNLRDLEIKRFAKEWGASEELLAQALNRYEPEKDYIPYITDLTNSLDFEAADVKESKNYLEYSMDFNDELKTWLKETKYKYGFDSIE